MHDPEFARFAVDVDGEFLLRHAWADIANGHEKFGQAIRRGARLG